MKKYTLKTNLGSNITALLQDEELIYGVTAIMIGTKTTYHIPCSVGLIKNEYTFHPITNEKLDIVVVDNKMLEEMAIMLVPAHIQEHFDLAKKYNLRFKQVVAPYFLGQGEEAINPDVKTQFRRSIIAVIKDPNTNKYLCVNAKKRLCKSFVMGGIEGDETPEQAMLREVEEETGYAEVKPTYTSLFVLHNHFYAGYKGVNRYAHLYVVFGELLSNKHNERTIEEIEKQEPLWLTKEEMKEFLSVNNNIFVYNNLLNGDVAFEQDGMMMNSEEMNGKLRSEVKKK